MKISEEITALFRMVFDDSDLTLTPEMEAKDVQGWDSLSNITLILAIETHFKIKISLGEQRSFKNVGDIAAYIENERAKNIDKGCS